VCARKNPPPPTEQGSLHSPLRLLWPHRQNCSRCEQYCRGACASRRRGEWIDPCPLRGLRPTPRPDANARSPAPRRPPKQASPQRHTKKPSLPAAIVAAWRQPNGIRSPRHDLPVPPPTNATRLKRRPPLASSPQPRQMTIHTLPPANTPARHPIEPTNLHPPAPATDRWPASRRRGKRRSRPPIGRLPPASAYCTNVHLDTRSNHTA
jgi:hypothetical protein